MRRRYVTLVPVLLAYLVALLQRPGRVIADTKVDLYVDPARFLQNVTSVWSPTVDLGHLFGAQYSGYVWPMAPWFAAGEALGIPTWLVHRLWLGTILAIAAWGVVRLLSALATSERGVLHLAAGSLYAINPYTTVYADRTSITLLTYAALPWLLLAIHRGLREPRRWRWPALFALVLTSTGGGVNVAVTAWVLLGPALFVLYERFWGEGVDWDAVWKWGWRLTLVTTLAQLWWVIPVAVQGTGAPNFLPFTEQPGTIWSTTSLTESIRLMGFWTSYVGVDYGGHLRPFQASAPAMLSLLRVVLSGLVLFGGALAGFPLVRRWRYAPYFLMLALCGLLVMSAGWPEGTPLRTAVTGIYYRVEAVDFLRTTYKGGALAALGLSVLAGAVIAEFWRRASARSAVRVAAVGVTAVVLAALASWPLVSGRAADSQLAFEVPPSWQKAAHDLDGRANTGTRALGVPGALFGFYEWGGTVDPILPVLTKRPVTTRWIVPYSDLRATSLQWSVDALLTQDRARPRQLGPLFDLLSVGDVVVNSDGDRGRGGEAPAGQVMAALKRGGGLAGRVVRYGGTRPAPVAPDSGAPRPPIADVTRVERGAPSMLQLLADDSGAAIDGSAGGITALAAFGMLDPSHPLAYAPDLGTSGIRRVAGARGHLVVSDTNRRAAFVASRLNGSDGPVLPASQGVSVDGTMLDPWFGQPDFQTVQELEGVRALSAPASPQVTQFPERRPFAALDGDPATAWMADRALTPERHSLTVEFNEARDVPDLELMPYSDSRGAVREVTVNGRPFKVRGGWNRLRVGLRGIRSLTVRLSDVAEPVHVSSGAGGIRELRIPGVKVREALRVPVTIEKALAGGRLDRALENGATLTYLLSRVTSDRPERSRRYVGERGAGLLRDSQDAERRIRRIIAPPLAKPVRLGGAAAWMSADPRTPDDVLDALAAGRLRPRSEDPRALSSSRWEGVPGRRASSAFDGSDARGWAGQWIAGRPAWISWTARSQVSLRELTLRPHRGLIARRPTRVALSADGGAPVSASVATDGRVVLPRALRGRDFRLTVLDARFAPGVAAALKRRRAVAIGEVVADGVPRFARASGGWVKLRCGAARISIGGRTLDYGVHVSRSDFENGRGLLAVPCGRAELPAGRTVVADAGGPLRLDAVALAAGGPRTDPRAGGAITAAPMRSSPGTVSAPDGPERDGGFKGARVRSGGGPALLVFGQSFNPLWRASCDGRDLGTPEPVQGYANGWRLTGGCRDLTISFGAQTKVLAGYVISGLTCLLLIAVVLLGFLRRRERPVAAATGDSWLTSLPEPAAARRFALTHALTIAIAAAFTVGVVFGLRAGLVALPLVAFALRSGVSDRLVGRLVAVLLVVAIPLAYILVAIITRGDIVGGNATDYASDRLAAHWLAVAAFVGLVWLLARTLGDRRRLSGDRRT